MERTDEELVGLVAGGDHAAMRVLYERYGDRLFRFALARIRDREEARDVTQDTLIATWQAAGTYRGASSVSTWLFGICRNKIGERLRRPRPLSQPVDLADIVHTDGASEAAVEFWDCFGKLDEDDQELILLVFHCGFAQREVAEITGVPVGTVKSRTHYARRRLQQLLREGE